MSAPQKPPKPQKNPNIQSKLFKASDTPDANAESLEKSGESTAGQGRLSQEVPTGSNDSQNFALTPVELRPSIRKISKDVVSKTSQLFEGAGDSSPGGHQADRVSPEKVNGGDKPGKRAPVKQAPGVRKAADQIARQGLKTPQAGPLDKPLRPLPQGASITPKGKGNDEKTPDSRFSGSGVTQKASPVPRGRPAKPPPPKFVPSRGAGGNVGLVKSVGMRPPSAVSPKPTKAKPPSNGAEETKSATQDTSISARKQAFESKESDAGPTSSIGVKPSQVPARSNKNPLADRTSVSVKPPIIGSKPQLSDKPAAKTSEPTPVVSHIEADVPEEPEYAKVDKPRPRLSPQPPGVSEQPDYSQVDKPRPRLSPQPPGVSEQPDYAQVDKSRPRISPQPAGVSEQPDYSQVDKPRPRLSPQPPGVSEQPDYAQVDKSRPRISPQPAGVSEEPEYAQVDKSRPRISQQPAGVSVRPKEYSTKAIAGRACAVGENNAEVAAPSASHALPCVPEAVDQSPASVPPKPPQKPPRTFAHDDYLHAKARRKEVRSADAHGYEEIADVMRRPGGSSDQRRVDSSGYEIVEGPFVNARQTVALAEQCVDRDSDPARRSAGKPNPPPRPPAPSGRPRSGETGEQLNQPGGAAPGKSRWDERFIRVKKHNERLTDEAFVRRQGVENPSYGQPDWQIIRGQPCVGLKRCKSDEFLYAEPMVRHAVLVPSDPYSEPADRVRPTGALYKVNAEGVAMDAEGYAIPEMAQHSPLQRQNTVTGGRPQAGKTGTLTGRGRFKPKTGMLPHTTNNKARSKPEFQEKLSKAYSVLRLNMLPPEAVPAEARGITDDDSDNEVDLEDHRKRLKYVSIIKKQNSSTATYASRQRASDTRDRLYDYSVIVGLEKIEDVNKYQTKVFFSFPEQKPELMTTICQFCFPDIAIWRPVSRYKSETFSFVLTDSDGSRQYGYCHRALPAGTGNRLPEVFCVVSSLDAFQFYDQLLGKLEQRRKLSLDHCEELLKAAYGKPIPDPGKEAWIRVLGEERKKETLFLKRQMDTRLDNISCSSLLARLSIGNLMEVFASILLERKVLFTAQYLSTLTSCIHAMMALLYPFTWHHVFIPVLPPSMVDVCLAPTPYVMGVLTSEIANVQGFDLEEVLLVDLDNDTLLKCQGDESTILPKKLQKALKIALKDDNDNSSPKDVMVMEAFLRFFVETLGHYTEYICTQMDGGQVFEKNAFITAVSSKSIRLFLEWFTETQMFEVFINDRMANEGGIGLFAVRIQEYREEMAEVTSSFKQNMKQVGRKMANFFKESGDKIKKKIAQSTNVYI